jgi:hypothetical protein
MKDDRRRKRARLYFRRGSVVLGLSLLILGIIPGVIYAIYALVCHFRRPADKEVDAWLDEDLSKVRDESFAKLGLDKEEDGAKKVRAPIPLAGPIFWAVPGVPNEEIKWRKGRDKIVRFSVNRFTILHFLKTGIAGYACDFNSFRRVALNDSTHEFHYPDIVSVTTQEESSSYTLQNGLKMVHEQEFRISVASGESISYVIGSKELKELTDGQIPTTEAERAILVIRKLLRERKGGIGQSA